MFWTGFIVGLFVGANVGIVVAAILFHSRRRAKSYDRSLARLKYGLDGPLKNASNRKSVSDDNRVDSKGN